MTPVALILDVPRRWNIPHRIFIYCAVVQTLMFTGSTFSSTSTITDIETTQNKVQDLSTGIGLCGLGTERCLSIATSYSETKRQLNPTTIAETSLNFVRDVTVANSEGPVTEMLSQSVDVDVTTATSKVTTVTTTTTQTTQTTHDSSLNDTKPFSSSLSDITRANPSTTDDGYRNGTEVDRPLRNVSSELEIESTATDVVTVQTKESSSISVVKEGYWQAKLYVTLFARVSPVLIVIGTLGNAMSIVTFQHPNFRSSSTGFILTALSAVDIGVLNTYLMQYWMGAAFGIAIGDLSRFSCKVLVFLMYYFPQLTSWTLILLTVERTIALWFPLRCKEFCSKRRIVIVWIIIAVIHFVNQIFVLIGYDLQPTVVGVDDRNATIVEYHCGVSDYWRQFFLNYKWALAESVLGDFFPFFAILIGNVLTIARIYKSQKERKTQMGAAGSTSKPMASTTAMLIGVSAMFLILHLPLLCLFIVESIISTASLDGEQQAIHKLVYAVGTLLFTANNALEFIVYFATGQKFRRAFLETFLRCRKLGLTGHSANHTGRSSRSTQAKE